MHEKMHVKLKKKKKKKKNEKERVIWTYRFMERKTLQEIRRKITKNLLWSLAESEREREKSLKTFEKGELNKSRSNLKKSLFMIFD